VKSCEVFEIQVIKICIWYTFHVICILYFAHFETYFVFCISITFFTVICILNTIWTRQFLTRMCKKLSGPNFRFPSFAVQFLAHFGVLRWGLGLFAQFPECSTGIFGSSPRVLQEAQLHLSHGVDPPYNGPVVYRQLVNMSDRRKPSLIDLTIE